MTVSSERSALRGAPAVDGLEAALSAAFAAAGPVEVLERERNVYKSTAGSEIVRCRIAGDERILLYKRGQRGEPTGRGHRGGVAYELDVYRHILAASTIGRPVLAGDHVEPGSGETWLFLDYIPDAARLDRTANPIEPLARTAAEIGRFQADVARSGRSLDPGLLIAYDRYFYLGWAERTSEFAGNLHVEFPWLGRVCARMAEVAETLLAAPVVVHGELTPHNVLAKGDAVFVLDWESTALAAGEIDLASLTDRWPEEVVQACERAYVEGRFGGKAPSDFAERFAAARVYWALRWLGHDVAWTHRERARFRFEQLRHAAAELGLVAG